MGILTGMRVLDFTQFLSVLPCTMMLGDLGAEVIKVERPDKELAAGPYMGGERTYDLSIMRGKKSITLNLKDPDQKNCCISLQKQPISSSNFKPGTMAKMGLAYEDIVKVNPQIIYTSISGYGHTGPYSEKGALDLVVQAASGFMSITGEPDGPPLKAGISAADLFTGLYAAIGTMAMVRHREKTGEGQYLDIAMLDSMMPVIENAIINYCISGKVPKRIGNRHAVNVPFQDFETKNGNILIAVNRDHQFAALCKVLGCEEMIDDPKYATSEARRQNREDCVGKIGAILKQWDTKDLSEALNKRDVVNGVINTIDQVVADPQIEAREMIVEVDHPTAGRYKIVNSPFKFSKSPYPCSMARRYSAPTTGRYSKASGLRIRI
jgi:crotonobetainyl-CoA:carnitine CoA-transferase CaiB-like acyl-CoA transferase